MKHRDIVVSVTRSHEAGLSAQIHCLSLTRSSINIKTVHICLWLSEIETTFSPAQFCATTPSAYLASRSARCTTQQAIILLQSHWGTTSTATSVIRNSSSVQITGMSSNASLMLPSLNHQDMYRQLRASSSYLPTDQLEHQCPFRKRTEPSLRSRGEDRWSCTCNRSGSGACGRDREPYK